MQISIKTNKQSIVVILLHNSQLIKIYIHIYRSNYFNFRPHRTLPSPWPGKLLDEFVRISYWRSTQDTDRDRYSLKDQRPKIKVSNDLIWLSELVSRLVIYNPITSASANLSGMKICPSCTDRTGQMHPFL